jgi:DNA-binding CsgD family transcriptional regulator/PAS domain-containing protein
MAATPQLLRTGLVELACSGHDFPEFAQRAVKLLDSAVSLDAWCVMTADPVTLLITGAVGENLPTSDPDNAAEFFRIEYSGEDFINFSDLARTGAKVGVLSEATGGDLRKSPRWRVLYGPAGLGDQMRTVCADGSACWGYLALHRKKGSPDFTRPEAKLISAVSRQLAEGIRLSLLVENADEENVPEGPGLILLDDDLAVVGVNSAAERLLDQVLRDPEVERVLPSAIFSVAALLRGLENRGEVSETPKARIKAASGRWLTAHATRLDVPAGERRMAVIVEPAPHLEAGAIALRAYGLTPRELEVAGLVLQGFSTAEIAARLVVSELTVQQHLKAVFEKAAVRSRRELVSEVFGSQYWSRMMEGAKPSPNGWFVEARTGQSD